MLFYEIAQYKINKPGHLYFGSQYILDHTFKIITLEHLQYYIQIKSLTFGVYSLRNIKQVYEICRPQITTTKGVPLNDCERYLI